MIWTVDRKIINKMMHMIPAILIIYCYHSPSQPEETLKILNKVIGKLCRFIS